MAQASTQFMEKTMFVLSSPPIDELEQADAIEEFMKSEKKKPVLRRVGRG